MSDRLAQYKKAGRTVLSKKAVMREEKAKETKRKRDDRFMGRRVLGDIQSVPSHQTIVKCKYNGICYFIEILTLF